MWDMNEEANLATDSEEQENTAELIFQSPKWKIWLISGFS